jgi:hypothetical protein
MLSLLIIHLIVCCCQRVARGGLKYIDVNVEGILGVMDLSKLSENRSIVIAKEVDVDYRRNVSGMMDRCSELQHFSSYERTFDYKVCLDDSGRAIKVIPAAEQSDLVPSGKYSHDGAERSFKSFAPHLILLDNVALYGYGDIMDLAGTSHYMGVCRQYGPPGYDSIDVKRKEVVLFFDEPVVNLVTLWTENYFNALIAYAPRVLSLVSLVLKNPMIKVAKNTYPSKAESFLAPILEYYGVFPEKLNLVNIEYGKVYFARHLVCPLSACKFIPKQFVNMIRMAVFDLYEVSPSPAHELRTIVVSDVSDLTPLSSKLHELYGHKFDVVRFSPKSALDSPDLRESLGRTVRLFGDCRLFISRHGAGLANIMFMNQGASVIEVRPEALHSWYFSYLSSTVGVRYYPFKCSVDKPRRKVLYNMDDMLAQVHSILLDSNVSRRAG